MHIHVGALTIAKPVIRGVIAGRTLPPTALVHIGTILSDGVRTAGLAILVDAFHWALGAAGGQLQAVHPAVGFGVRTLRRLEGRPRLFYGNLVRRPAGLLVV